MYQIRSSLSRVCFPSCTRSSRNRCGRLVVWSGCCEKHLIRLNGVYDHCITSSSYTKCWPMSKNNRLCPPTITAVSIGATRSTVASLSTAVYLIASSAATGLRQLVARFVSSRRDARISSLLIVRATHWFTTARLCSVSMRAISDERN